eukprot:206986-Prorocentrum_minimum.AAC.1
MTQGGAGPLPIGARRIHLRRAQARGDPLAGALALPRAQKDERFAVRGLHARRVQAHRARALGQGAPQEGARAAVPAGADAAGGVDNVHVDVALGTGLVINLRALMIALKTVAGERVPNRGSSMLLRASQRIYSPA